MLEIWKPVKDYPLYRVSNLGGLKSFWGDQWTFVKGSKTMNGYMQFKLLHVISKQVFIHRIVLEAFKGQCPEGYVCNHKDGDKTNNFISNLEWVTPSENVLHAQQSRTKWDDGEIWLLKKMLYHGIKRYVISKMFKMGVRSIYRISKGDQWFHIVYGP